MALTSLVCGLMATVWLREFGDGSIRGPFVGMFLSLVPIGGAAQFLTSRGPMNRVLRVLAVPAFCLVGLMLMGYWVSRAGAHVVPPVPEFVGIAVSAGAVFAGARSLWLREGAPVVAFGGALLGLFVLVTAFVVDVVTNSPYHAVRQYAAASQRGDEASMRGLLSTESLKDIAETSALPSHLSGVGGRNALLLKITIDGDRAVVDCPVPDSWSLFGMKGHGGEVELIREGSEWKVDTHRQWIEMLKRFGEE